MAKARILFAIRCSLFALVLAASTPVFAQGWPQRPVKVLVPFAAGGNIDVMGRLAASRLSEAFGQQFVVENRVGGNGVIAAEAVARAAPDGYTLLWAPTSVIATFRRSPRWLTTRSRICAISLFSVAPQVLIVNPKFRSERRRVHAHVKSQKEKVAGGGGPGSSSNSSAFPPFSRAGLDQ
jgi:tripartite-type tricarboxylate transporter receptor subunit TctC